MENFKDNLHENLHNFLETQLNKEQKSAVLPKDGVLLVRAGAGSGKTRVITARIANLIIAHGIRSENIIALTFTNKAAKEMRERVSHFLANTNQLPYVGTFHSYCLKILKQNMHILNMPSFTILDSDDQEKIIKKIIAQKNLTKRVTVKQASSGISKIKNEVTNTKQTYSNIFNSLSVEPIIKDIFLEYEKEKKNAFSLDFDDLLLETLKIFQNNPEFKSKFQEHIRHILVDEYQDTNVVQHALLQEMCLMQKNKFAIDSLCVVGDEDQSIYSWRGATISNILNFQNFFQDTKNITIAQNYRSIQEILDLANNLIKNNSNRNKKELWSDKQGKNRIKVLTCNSGIQEAEAISTFLKTAAKTKNLNDLAVLYRSHFQSRQLEEALIRHSIPYLIVGGIQFYERLEIKDIVAYIKLIDNPYDKISFSRAINCPSRGLGEKFQEKFMEFWNLMPFSMFTDAIKGFLISDQLTAKQKDGLSKFMEIFDNLTKITQASDAINQIIIKTDYLNYLKENFDEQEGQAKIENVKELINSSLYLQEGYQRPVWQFLENIALLEEAIKVNTNSSCVKLMTLHSAKGLEFDTVVISGLEENVVPSSHSLYMPDRLEEERRLFYVGITRAREYLLITNAKQRYAYGQVTSQLESRFINELGDVEKEDASYWSAGYFSSCFASWLKSKVYYQEPVETPIKTNFSTKKINIKFSKNSKVSHETFGPGVIEDLETKNSDKTYATVRFASGTKKIDTKFLTTQDSGL